jgi:DNA-binding FadR family transcriptional regulator
MAELLRRLRYLLQQRRLQRELADDMDFHREMAARSGNSNFGNVLRMQEQAREAWGWMRIDRLMQAFTTQDAFCCARLASRSLLCSCWLSVSERI